MAKEERRLNEYDQYPPPPYSRDLFKIPDNMYGELQLKRLLHGLYTTSDPKGEKDKSTRLYPRRTLDGSENSDDNGEHQYDRTNTERVKPAIRPRLPLPNGDIWKEREIKAGMGSTTNSSDTEENIKKKSLSAIQIKLKGGVNPNSGSSNVSMIVCDSEGDVEGASMMVTPSGLLVRKTRESSPPLQAFRDSEIDDDDNTTGIRVKKRKKDADALKAVRTVNPGIRQEVALEHRNQARRLGSKLSELITTEVGKKKVSQSILRDFQAVKDAVKNWLMSWL